MRRMKSTMQQSLFGNDEFEYLTIDDSASALDVSSATIRNWIKTGYIECDEKGRILRASVDEFKANVAGKEKLNQRANKSRKDSHDHYALAKSFLDSLNSENAELNLIGSLYENSLSDSHRNKEGIYYTPINIVNDILKLSDIDYANIKNLTFCDPCCGSGNFIMRAIDLGFSPENVFGFDTDPIAVEITKQRIFEKTGYNSINIQCFDFLQHSISRSKKCYDYIFTNPPWGKKIKKADKLQISKALKAGDSHDTCSLFYFSCIKSLNSNGFLGLLLPEAFFNVGVYEDARISSLSYRILRISHYGKPFKGLQTGAVGIVFRKEFSNPNALINCKFENLEFNRTTDSFKKNPKSIFNVSCTSEESEVISHLYSIPHLTLHGAATWGLGIVTGNNSKYLESCYRDGLIPVYKGSDITESGLKSASNFLSTNFSMYQQVAPLELYKAKEKLIYKFISSKLCFYHDTNSVFIINSANMLIINGDFPVSMKIICDLFNSNFINWVFDKLFHTCKILKGDLELLPIHHQFLTTNIFSEREYLASLNIERSESGTYRVKR
jgi:site-specific DNA-methyltransferase (adenine-specific)